MNNPERLEASPGTGGAAAAPVTAHAIARRQDDGEGLDFASLRETGIAALQDLAGNIWSDYNLHDPGVTILEQLCYGLTELVYQMRIPVADQLADERGLIPVEDYFLYKPQDILPSRAVTPEDYAKTLLDQIADIDAITISSDNGLYDIRLKLVEPLIGQPLAADDKAGILAQVKQLYLAQRNLGEDINSIQLEEGSPCYLQGTIETTGKRPLAAIYADVFFQAARRLSSHVHIQRYETLAATESDLTRIFTGPLTRHGYIHSEGLAPEQNSRPLDELNALISRIEGVKKVYHLELVDGDGKPVQPGQDEHCYFLQFPDTLEQQKWLKIDFNPGKTDDPTGVVQGRAAWSERLMADTRRALQKLEFEYRAFRSNKANASNIYKPPQGLPRLALDYYSIQHQFPHVYGINSAGVPPSAGLERRQQAQQLKAYLYPMEQLMANLLEQVQQLHRLFHRAGGSDASYFCQWLDNLKVPNLEAIYRDPARIEAQVRQIQASHDPALERKSRALDTLLALYGEIFSQEALLHFNYYYNEQSGYWVISNKLRFLTHLIAISSSRGGGADLRQSPWGDDPGGLYTRLGILLGIENLAPEQLLSSCFERYQVQVIESQRLLAQGEFIELDDTAPPLYAVPQLSARQQERLNAWQVRNSKPLSLTPIMLREGTNLDTYRLSQDGEGAVTIYFCPPNKPRGLMLRRCQKREEAVDYVHRFKKIITQVNLQGEGFYLVEHLLLRPRQPQAPLADDFYPNRLSLVFPRWSARFSNPAFRQFAEKTIANQCPAHLLPQIYWVDLDALRHFETVYLAWREQLQAWCTQGGDAAALDRAANNLRRWLESQTPSDAVWI